MRTFLAVIALVIAASGSAVAATRLVAGDTLIKRNSLSGDRLRNHSVSRRQIDLGRLGTVPSALSAGHAAAADRASAADRAAAADHAAVADTATNAANAADSAKLAGQPPSAFEPSSAVIRSGLVTAGVGHTVTVASAGPFTLTLKCANSGSSVYAELDAASTEANSLADSSLMQTPGVTEPLTVIGPSATLGGGTQADSLVAPSGKAYEVTETTGINWAGQDCYADALITRG